MPVPSLANLSPIEVFTGLECPSPLKSIVGQRAEGSEQVVSVESISDSIMAKVDALRQHLHKMHRKLEQAKSTQTRRNQRNQHSATPVNFHIGDFVLWSRIESRLKTNKLSVKWVGPYRVVDAKPNAFTVTHLLTGATRDVYASRLKLYADSSFDVTEEVLEHIANQDVYLTVRNFVEHRSSMKHGYEVLVAWEGLEDIENSWEPARKLHEDVPIKLQRYVDQTGDVNFAAYVLTLAPNGTTDTKAVSTSTAKLRQPPTNSKRGSASAGRKKTQKKHNRG